MTDTKEPLFGAVADKWLLRILGLAGAITFIGLFAYIWYALYCWVGDSESLWTIPVALAIASVTIVLVIPMTIIAIAAFLCTFERFNKEATE